MTPRTRSIVAAALAGTLWASLPLNATMLAPEDAAAAPAVPEFVGHGIAYINGGVGLDEVALLRQMAPQYSLRIVISGRDGEYGVADRLVVSGPHGVHLAIADAGPWVMMKLPPGRYSLEATFRGETQRRTAQVGRGHTVVHWNTLAAST